ncbi:hypothetical protein Q7P35_004575 [Cladosporium inversicolor]
MPGVPPNALADLKKAFKSLLRPDRRRREQEQQAQQQAQQQTQQQAQQQAQAAQQQAQQTDAANTPNVPPQLPPTHPIATGQHSEPQNALPKPGDAAAPTAASEGATEEQVKKQGEDKAPVSPAAPAPVAKDEAPKSEPVSAISTEHDKPLPLPKTDGANDVKAAAPLPSNPTTQEPLNTTSENAKPSVNALVAATAPVTAAPAPTPATTETQPAAKTSSESARDEKMPVMAEEPPEIKAKAAAPGMSATSGPLDDFPIQDDKP